MTLTTATDVATIRKAAEISTDILDTLRTSLSVGIYPSQIEEKAWQLSTKYKVTPSFFGVSNRHYGKYKYSCCISVNEEILHGIPSNTRKMQSGDVVKLDFGIIYNGYYTDHCYTFILGEPSEEDLRLVQTSKKATESAMMMAIHGNRIGDIGSVMHSIAQKQGYDVLKDYVGHGIGKHLHEDPDVPAYGIAGHGEILKEGMALCIESQVVSGTDLTITQPNGWTIISADGKKASMFEYMVIVRQQKPEVLTKMEDWPIVIG
jgi:methionyl aminopeptidase